jgi:hypothetical protein
LAVEVCHLYPLLVRQPEVELLDRQVRRQWL